MSKKPDGMRIFARDLGRALRAAGLGKREFLKRVEARNPLLADKLRRREREFEISTAGEFIALVDALKLTTEHVHRENQRRRLGIRKGDRGEDVILTLIYLMDGERLQKNPLADLKTMLALTVNNVYARSPMVWHAVKLLSRDPVKSVGWGLAQGRSELGITQAELARRTGLRRDVIAKLENGQFKATSPAYEKAWWSKCQRVIRALGQIEEQRQKT